ncbi:MAG: GGDEF domain-containing protein [Coriobacteriales bacterium]|nr:GGDEF domain-containing protein [Coriobacteriales bacterium]
MAEETSAQSYQDFLLSNRVRVNQYLNVILWLFTLTGPALAIGVVTGAFPDITYMTCIGTSVLVAILSGVHMLLLKLKPKSRITSFFALIALNIVVVYLSLNYVNIQLTWFLVPLLSLLFCDRPAYFGSLILNYVLLLASMWQMAPHYSELTVEFETVRAYFFNEVGGLTIETFIMASSGYIILKLTDQYFRELFRQNEIIRAKEQSEKEQLSLLNSMAEIYDNVNLIDFVASTEMSLRDPKKTKHKIDMPTQTHTRMNQSLAQHVMPDQLDAFLTYTNITTVRDRLRNRKIISSDFIDVVTGWFRAQYISVQADKDGRPDVVIYTTRNVDDEKRREEHLIRLSMTDEMTRLYNRRCYEEDLAEYRKEPLPDDFVVFSIDVNGLKKVNDTLGHAAGDELIKGAADCLVLTIRQGGKAYRTGGDEFMAVVHTNSPEKIRESIHQKASEWHGMYTDKITMSVGYAAFRDHADASVDDLEHIADADMYAEKERYYRETGIDRRRR